MHESYNEIIEKIVFILASKQSQSEILRFWEAVSHFFFDITFPIFLPESHQDRYNKKQKPISKSHFENFIMEQNQMKINKI